MYQSHRQGRHKTKQEKITIDVINHLSGWSQSAAKGAWKRRQGGCFFFIDGIIEQTFGDAIATGGEDTGRGTVASQPC